MPELNYNQISLIPKKCMVNSRRECDTSVKLGKHVFDMPIYPANMRSVVDEDTCEYLAENNWFYTMHRFGKEIIPRDWVIHMKEREFPVSISLGINQESLDSILLFQGDLTPEYITIDVANAWYDRVGQMAKTVKSLLPSTFLIIGNIATPEAVEEIQSWGVADALKVGIAGGSVCITKNKTGYHRPMVDTVRSCSEVSKIPIIADGGIKEHGDIAKALACGATMAMAGYLFAGYDRSAGSIIEINDLSYKEYFGSASKYNKEEAKNIEGKKILIPYRGEMSRLLRELKEDLQSSISYGGGSDLSVFDTSKIILLK